MQCTKHVTMNKNVHKFGIVQGTCSKKRLLNAKVPLLCKTDPHYNGSKQMERNIFHITDGDQVFFCMKTLLRDGHR